MSHTTPTTYEKFTTCWSSLLIPWEPTIVEDSIMGYRKPGTETGSWSGAWVACHDNHGKVICALFENNMDYIGGDITWDKILEEKSRLMKEGWEPMSREDIRDTSGFYKELNDST